MKTIIRNFINVLKGFQLSTALNIAGLTVAFAAFIVILIQVMFEYNFDRMYSTADRIYRVDKTVEGPLSMVQTHPFIEEFIKSSPHIEAGGLIFGYPSSIYFYITDQEEKHGFLDYAFMIQPDIVKVFDFPIIYGDQDCLQDPEKMMIPQSLAQKLFGNESPVGKQIQTDENLIGKELKDFTIGAVYKDFPGNSQLNNIIYLAIDKDFGLDNYYSSEYLCYVLLDKPSSADIVEDNFNSYYKFPDTTLGATDPENVKAKLFPITDVYFKNSKEFVVKTVTVK